MIASPRVKYRGPFVLGMPAEAPFNVPMMQKDQSMLTAARALGLGDHDFAVVFDVLGAPLRSPRQSEGMTASFALCSIA